MITERSIALGRTRAAASAAGRPVSAPAGGRELGERSSAVTFMDAVFGERASTREVYERAFRGIVAGAAEGLNGAILAYGQTSSGKTYSMSGSTAHRGSDEEETGGEKGIIHYALEDLFFQLAAREDYARAGAGESSYAVRLSYCEIYLERVNDLLRDGGPNSQHLPVKEDAESRSFYVEGLRERAVSSAEEVVALLSQAERRRRVACTRYNEVSSRSHTLLTLIIEYTSPVPSGLSSDAAMWGDAARVTRVGRLVFVDLAGNERVEAGAEYMAESNSINKSLFFLGKVIERLAGAAERCERRGAEDYHLPVRDSNLTRLLALHLGGNSRTGLLVNVTPAADAVEESLSTLRFAQKASTIRSVAQPVASNREQRVIVWQQETIAQLHQQVQELREHQMQPASTGLHGLLGGSGGNAGAACRMVQHLREENARLRSSLRYMADRAKLDEPAAAGASPQQEARPCKRSDGTEAPPTAPAPEPRYELEPEPRVAVPVSGHQVLGRGPAVPPDGALALALRRWEEEPAATAPIVFAPTPSASGGGAIVTPGSGEVRAAMLVLGVAARPRASTAPIPQDRSGDGSPVSATRGAGGSAAEVGVSLVGHGASPLPFAAAGPLGREGAPAQAAQSWLAALPAGSTAPPVGLMFSLEYEPIFERGSLNFGGRGPITIDPLGHDLAARPLEAASRGMSDALRLACLDDLCLARPAGLLASSAGERCAGSALSACRVGRPASASSLPSHLRAPATATSGPGLDVARPRPPTDERPRPLSAGSLGGRSARAGRGRAAASRSAGALGWHQARRPPWESSNSAPAEVPRRRGL